MNDPLYLEAVEIFREKFARTSELGMREPAAMSLATCGADGRPSVRTVLLRGVDERGFVFFTNSLSRKGRQMTENPHVGLAFYWDRWQEQAHVEGIVTPIDDAEADAYWEKRARLSRIGAWASLQSQPLDARETLLQRVADFEKQFADQEVPRPPHWLGYRVIPNRIEHWHGADGRLHERVVYELNGDRWVKGFRYP